MYAGEEFDAGHVARRQLKRNELAKRAWHTWKVMCSCSDEQEREQLVTGERTEHVLLTEWC